MNAGLLSPSAFTTARSLLRSEVLFDPSFLLLTIPDEAILAGVVLTDRHSLNASDAAILDTYLRHANDQPPDALPCVVVAADQRLIRAAAGEGLRVCNPERVSAADVPAFLASL